MTESSLLMISLRTERPSLQNWPLTSSCVSWCLPGKWKLNFNCNFTMPFPAHCPDLLAGYTWLYDSKWKISVAVAFFVHVLCSSWFAKARTFQGPYDSHIAAAPSNEGSSRKAWIVWSPRFKDGGSSKCAAKPEHFNMSYHNQQPTAGNSKLHTGVAILVIILSYHI